MDRHVSIPVDQFLAVIAQITDQLAGLDDPDLKFESDFFWAIPGNELFNVYDAPPDLTIGQISDSWANLKQGADVNDTAGLALVWLSDVLRAIGVGLVT